MNTGTQHPTDSERPVRVRFAPSPTGYLHVGGLRTALYNYLFARRYNGTFILRIEDTDQTRYVKGAVENLIATLRWAGLAYDEGPDIGGPYGPYTQSERLALYREHAETLLSAGRAYRCFCTSQDLDEMRSRQEHAGEAQMYDRRCRMLTEAEVEERLSEGRPHTIRMSVPLIGDVSFDDHIRGHITVNCNVIDDQVLLKSDGFPTYHLANVIDDHHMRITHVIRGEEWLPSTAKHVLLYQSFGWDTPEFAHLPLLLNPDRTKLSKRQGDVAVEDYRARGFLPEALVNFVALLGWNTSDNRELYTLAELSHEFSLDRVGKAGAVFDVEKLSWFNGQYLRSMPVEAIADLCRPLFREKGLDDGTPAFLTIIESVVKYLTFPSDALTESALYFEDAADISAESVHTVLATESARTVLAVFAAQAQEAAQWDRASFKDLMKTVQKESGVKGADLYKPVRLALTGREHGPDLPLIAEVFGQAKCLSRIEAALA